MTTFTGLALFSKQPLRPLCLSGESFSDYIHHRVTEDAEVAQKHALPNRRLLLLEGFAPNVYDSFEVGWI